MSVKVKPTIRRWAGTSLLFCPQLAHNLLTPTVQACITDLSGRASISNEVLVYWLDLSKTKAVIVSCYRTLHIKAHPLQFAPLLGSIIFYSRKGGISLVIQVNASALPSKSPTYAIHARKVAAGSTVCIGALPVSHTSQPAICDILQVSPLARLIGDWQSIRLPQGYYAHSQYYLGACQ